MKTILCLAYFVAALSVHAGELLQNSDFSDGKDHWFGDGVSPSDLSPDDPLAADSSAKEMIVQLKPHHWTKVAQEFHTDAVKLAILITFNPSPDAKFADTLDAYKNQVDDLRLWTIPLNYSAGQFFYGILDDTKRIWFDSFGQISMMKGPHPTLQHNLDNAAISNTKTIYLAFPPGTGDIIIKSISVTSSE
jgi:hypothetical protein